MRFKLSLTVTPEATDPPMNMTDAIETVKTKFVGQLFGGPTFEGRVVGAYATGAQATLYIEGDMR